MNTVHGVSQDLRAMTVEVRHPGNHEVRGTAIFVSTRLLATCAHVLRDCGVEARQLRGPAVLIRIPATREYPEEFQEARVCWVPRNSDEDADTEDDLVLIELEAGVVPQDRVAKCASAEETDLDPFRSYGFRVRGEYTALFADGHIVGHVPGAGMLLVDPLQLRSPELDSGMSGGAVFDLKRNLVVGFVRQVYDSAGTSSKDPDLAWAVDAGVLRHSSLVVLEESLALAPPLAPDVEPSLLRPCTALPSRDFTEHAPDALGAFVNRTSEMAVLDQVWATNSHPIVVITGLPGKGKTSLAREWLSRVRSNPEVDNFTDSIFWWSLQSGGWEVDSLLSALVTHLSGGRTDPRDAPTTTARANLAALLLAAGRHIIVLDGLDVAQEDRGDLAGNVTSPGLADFLFAAAAGKHNSLFLITSRTPLVELERYTAVLPIDLQSLSNKDSQALLLENGVIGSTWELDRLVKDWGGHPLALTAVAAILQREHGGIATRVPDLPASSEQLQSVVRLRALGNYAEAGRSDLEVAILHVLARARTPLPPEFVAQLIAHDTQFTATDVALGLERLVHDRVCRRDRAGWVLLHPVWRNLYRLNSGLLPTEALVALHRSLAEYYYSVTLVASRGDHG